MPQSRKSTRNRLIAAALELFASKGITETTTKAVAERAGVNEVTLFRHFGSKQGLLLAVLEDVAVFTRLGKGAIAQAGKADNPTETLRNYANLRLQMLERVPELVRSLIGEAGQYSPENRQALGRGLQALNCYIASDLDKLLGSEQLASHFPTASLLNSLLLGYFLVELTSEGHDLWQGREQFLDSVAQLFITGAISQSRIRDAIAQSQFSDAIPLGSAQGKHAPPKNAPISDLPAPLVHTILQRAKRKGRNEYAWVYVLFSAGLSPQEIVTLERSNAIGETDRHLLQINIGAVRQVPLSHWILGKRYGSPTNNPLTQWLKNRKDDRAALFLNEQEQPLEIADLQETWELLTEGLLTPQGQPPAIEQARQTWCIEMLSKGIEIEDLSILSGMTVEQLQPYAQRAREKTAIEQATRLDRSSS
ncbi:TetR family transcriptional regulator [Lusitaniella coriacea LEGE 07157]|uniref:TetR family transcriptional regulator n=1 Tax=Lusitaniella coriacea LEGE 07157 TaxID=945747 RepID=A0A8J7IU32_9CYAN|nr:TetR family transcriptional regulator [Lusitaniella coriacea]MBE9116248.1 TetR family transcriptional regulator [Lusitaniella coriacea LEGE 07157]